MSRELINQLYEDTALWLWPFLWLEIIRMQRFINALPDADDPRVLYEIYVTGWGGLRLRQLTHYFGPDPCAWMNNPKINGDTLCAEYWPDWRAHFPALAEMPTREATPTRDPMGTTPLHLDPG